MYMHKSVASKHLFNGDIADDSTIDLPLSVTGIFSPSGGAYLGEFHPAPAPATADMLEGIMKHDNILLIA